MSPWAVLPPERGEAATYTVMVGGSPCKMAVVGDAEEVAKCAGTDQLYDHATTNAYPCMLRSVEERNITPKGNWVLVVFPLDTDPHDILDESVWRRMDEQLEKDPGLSVLYIAMIVDSTAVTAYLNGDLN